MCPPKTATGPANPASSESAVSFVPTLAHQITQYGLPTETRMPSSTTRRAEAVVSPGAVTKAGVNSARGRLLCQRCAGVSGCAPGCFPGQSRADAGKSVDQAAPQDRCLGRAGPVHWSLTGLPKPLFASPIRRQPVLRRRQLISAPRQKDSLGILARRHTHQRIQNTAIGIHQDQIAQLPDRFDRERSGIVLGMVKAQKQHPLERHRQLDRLQPRAAYIFAQQEQERRFLRHTAPGFVFEQMDAAGLRMGRKQKIAPLPVGINLQGDAAAVRQNDLLYPAARDRLFQFVGHRSQRQSVEMHARTGFRLPNVRLPSDPSQGTARRMLLVDEGQNAKVRIAQRTAIA